MISLERFAKSIGQPYLPDEIPDYDLYREPGHPEL